MARVANWNQILYREIEAARKKSFVWGEFDCACFVSDISAKIGGPDFWAPLRGKYTDRLGCVRAMREYFGPEGDQIATPMLGITFFDHVLEGREVALSRVQRGDIGAIEHTEDEAYGHAAVICMGETLIGLLPNGIASVPCNALYRAWKV